MDWGPMVARAIAWLVVVLGSAGIVETIYLSRRGKLL